MDLVVPVLHVEDRTNSKLPLVQQDVFNPGQVVGICLCAIVNIELIDYKSVVVRLWQREGWTVHRAYTILQPLVLLFEPTNFVLEPHLVIS